MKRFYPIGTPGKAWDAAEKLEWFNAQTVKRSYQELVVSKMNQIRELFDVVQYGALPMDAERYPLFAAKTRVFDEKKPTVLVTGGVHGYETSGVIGALQFLLTAAKPFEKQFNLVVCPCVSPWGFETVNRWNPEAHDPNRNFIPNSPAPECAFVMAFLQSLNVTFLAHIDLHETTDTDESEFSPAKAARDGGEYVPDYIPDGFYLVAAAESPQPEFQKAMIDGVRKVTHIAPPDPSGQIIGCKVEQEGVINIPGQALGLCMGMLKPKYATTTEVYPDSPKVDAANCNDAQVACVVSGLEFIASEEKL